MLSNYWCSLGRLRALFAFLKIREINVSATKKDGTPTKGKSESNETKTVKQVLSYIAYKAAYEANPTQINKRSWKRIQHAYIVMKCNCLSFET